jgi:hypothetical protein
MRTTVSSRGQTAVRRFGLRGNSRLEWIIEGDVITVLPVPPDPVRAFRGSLTGKCSVNTLLRQRLRERRRERAHA